MPPRLNKRQLREQEELAALEAAETPEHSESEEENVPSTSGGGGFAALMSFNTNDDQEEDEEGVKPSSSKKKKKKKKAHAESSTATPVSDKPHASPQAKASGTSTPSKPEKSKKKAGKQKAKAQKDDYDIDKALAELALKHPGLAQATATNVASRTSAAFHSLLSVSLQHLDSEAEMKRFFGAKVVSASKASDSSSSGSQNRHRKIDAKSNLTRPQNTWWPANLRQGLSIRSLTKEELEDRNIRHEWDEDIPEERIWTVEFSNKYRGATKRFIQMVMSGDPEGFYEMLRVFPYHADTLLQLSEVYYHREEHSTAADFIDRALFTYEKAFTGAFSFTTGYNRLDFDRVENRPFFLAVHRNVSDLQRRGCVRTAFEFAKLLYSLDPSTDPHGALLHLDFLAIKTGMTQWLLDIWKIHGEMGESLSGKFSVRALPGWAYARALAMFIIEETKAEKNHEASTSALKEAIRAFPSVIPVLANKLDAPVSAEILSHSAFRLHIDARNISKESDAILHLLSHLYVQRSHSLWKPKIRLAWFTETVNSLIPFHKPISLPSNELFNELFSSSTRRFSIYRHVLVLETTCRPLFSFLPSAVTQMKQLACDPLPPPSSVSEYNSEFFEGTEDPFAVRLRSRRENERLLERLIPNVEFRRQLQAVFAAHPQFAQRFPGGIVQFAQVAAQMPELLEDMMVAAIDDEREGVQVEGQMPGGVEVMFVDEDDHDEPEAIERQPQQVQPQVEQQRRHEEDIDEHDDQEDEEDEDEEDLEPVQPLPVRIIRNVLNRFWGGETTAAETEDSSDDEGGGHEGIGRDSDVD
ncbi:transcriptional repressor TCF25-domain-containing protein [Abortiporus biennis]|nr:transcriptional repressor TCF25-domain-containing protein [Abortiporus biennis]